MRRPEKAPPKLTAARRRWVNEQIAAGRFTDESEAINFCVQQAARLDAAQREFDRLIAEGDKGPFERVDAEWWSRLRADSDARRRARTRRKSA
jgi:Arc/MetJ-type ribon-helix-helix transcriptional regulator